MSDEMKKDGPFEAEAKTEASAPESTAPVAPAPEAPKAEEATPAAEEVKAEAAPAADASDVDQNKPMAIIGYLIPILFFIPMLSEKKSPFGMFHAKQQLNLLLSAIAVNIIGTVIPFLGWFIILPIGSIVLIVLAIMGIINAAKGEMKQLPIIGGFQIIK
jgi:uncharacterized membrane protein